MKDEHEWNPELYIQLAYGTHGKPKGSQAFADIDLRFNVSRSEETAVYVFPTVREIGIDVEALREIPNADEIAARCFSRRENEEYLALDQSDRLLRFFNCWTRKEAFIKALGGGLSHSLDCFDVSLVPGEPAEILRVESTPGDARGWRLESFSVNTRLVGAIVIQTPKP